MTPFEDLETRLTTNWDNASPIAAAEELLAVGEAVLENWIESRDEQPTDEKREGFRLLALHRQGAKGVPSFNACRETCRELAYHYNLITMSDDHAKHKQNVTLMTMVANHLYLFVSGKMQVEQLGEFCCASKPIRNNAELN